MTELERARAHLRLCQMVLADRRRLGWAAAPDENMVLAALSWLWEEQEKAALADCVNAIFALANAKWTRRANFLPPRAIK